jgi:hypothetical protein
MGIRELTAGALSAVTLLALTGTAGAQTPFGAKGTLAITGENLAGYHAEKRKYDNEAGDEYQTQRGGLGLLFTTGGARVGVHYFLLPQFSVGGAVGYDLRTGSNTIEDGDGTYTTDLAKEHTLVVATRAGYALMFTDVVGFWFRGGPGVEHQVRRAAQWNDQDKDTDTVWLASLDVFFVVAPVPHFGFYVGPQGDISFAGKHKEARLDNATNEVNEWHNPERYSRLGASMGLIGFF